MTDTPELIAMARAICEARCVPGTKPAKPAPWSSDTDKRAARAALLAIRDLSPEAVEPAQEICGRDYVGKGFDSDMTDPEEVWTAIINHITGESA